MKKAIWLLFFALTVVAMNAQNQPPQGPPPPPTAEQRAEHLEKLAKELKLTDEQKAKWKEAEDHFFVQAEKIQAPNREKMETLRKERDEVVKEILTADQYTQLKKMEEERRKQGPPKRKGN